MLTPGTLIDGRFEIIDILGEGGMGTVYSAQHKVMGRKIALKVLKSTLVSQPETVARFRNEARVLSGLDHPNIITVHAVGIAETGQPYMAMDIVSGKSIYDLILENGPFKQAEALQICIQICNGLQYAHQKKIIHRDIKPSNIIITNAGNGASVAMLVDFGIAKMLDSQLQQLTQTGMAVGSSFYLSPGQMEGRGADASSDIYSLGCTLYEMLAGVPPFQADNAFETAMMHKNEPVVPVNAKNDQANIDEAVQRIIDLALQKGHQGRYHSAKELGEDLQCALQGKTLKFAQKVEPVRRSKFSGKALLLAGLTGAITVVAGLLFFRPQNYDPVSLEHDTTAQSAVDSAVVLQAGHTGQSHVMPKVEEALALAKKSGDAVLIARAYRMHGGELIASHLTDPQGARIMVACLDDFNKGANAAEQGLAGTKAPDRIHTLLNEQYLCRQAGFRLHLMTRQPMPDSEWPSLLKSFKDALAAGVLGEEQRSLIDRATAALVREHAAKADGRLIHYARIRAETMKLLGSTPEVQQQEYLANLSKVRELHPGQLAEFAKIYGQ
jgi:tRNA A-37 threonylcarbamoyl transferase component Bud32